MERTKVAGSPLPLLAAPGDVVVRMAGADVGRNREVMRKKRLWRFAFYAGLPALYLWWRIDRGHPLNLLRMPHIDLLVWMPVLFFVVLILSVVMPFVIFGRSPHVLYRPEQLDVRLDDVVGIDAVKEEVVRSLNLFLGHQAFMEVTGGTPRRGILFEGGPGTGKTHTAKAMAAEAGVPFLFVSGTSFQSMFQGASALKIRNFFKKLRSVALAEGGAIAFIEEIDAIGMSRRGMNSAMTEAVTPAVVANTPSLDCCGSLTMLTATSRYDAQPGGSITTAFTGGGDLGSIVNELLVQMQSFDMPSGRQKFAARFVDAINLMLPLHRQIPRPTPPRANVLIIAATNRADSLDPALLRPGRFDRSLTFEKPDQRGRRALIDHFLARKAHHEELADDEYRDALAAVTHAYTPAMIENLLDEALVNAVRRGDTQMTWKDIERARLTTTVGLGQPIGYTDHEKRLIATHEAGHATAAYLVAPTRRLEVLSIIKRREALGMLAHGDAEEVFTRSRTEMLQLIQIALAGQCAEEIFFGDVSTGPSGDLLYATNVAAQMVGAAGMAGTLVSYAAVQGSAFSDTNLVGRVLGDGEGRARVEEMLQEQKVLIKGRMEANQHLVRALRDALLERNELVGHEITEVLEDAGGPADAVGSSRVIDLREAATVDRAVASSVTTD
ncbi:MAG: AAA family ATPase [Frankiales bacterium]|nr:AAA family ATPase [Frankiales bacterium]